MEQSEESVLITEDGLMHGGKLDPVDVEIIETAKTGKGAVKIDSMQELMTLARALLETFECYRQQARKCMTKEQAEFVRSLRVEKGYSWRAVARACHDNFQEWERWAPPSSQPMGMALCDRAAQFFGEDYMESPWN